MPSYSLNEVTTAKAAIHAQEDKNNFLAGVVCFDQTHHVVIAGGPDNLVGHVGAGGFAERMGRARRRVLGSGHVDHQAAAALAAVLRCQAKGAAVDQLRRMN